MMNQKQKRKLFVVVLTFFVATAFLVSSIYQQKKGAVSNVKKGTSPPTHYDADSALSFVKQQVVLGPRYPTSPSHTKAQDFILTTLKNFSSTTQVESFNHTFPDGKTVELKNIIARFNPENENRILLVTHYDTVRYVHNDPKNAGIVPGANNGASGTAVLLEIARTLSLSKQKPSVGIDLVFFDGEEGDEDWTKIPWHPIGSEYFSKHLKGFYPEKLPELAINIDMVGDKDLNLYEEVSSLNNVSSVVSDLWSIGTKISPSAFHSWPKYTMLDDFTPLQVAGIPSVIMIDFDYPAIYTTMDDITMVSPESLYIVGQTLLKYLYSL